MDVKRRAEQLIGMVDYMCEYGHFPDWFLSAEVKCYTPKEKAKILDIIVTFNEHQKNLGNYTYDDAVNFIMDEVNKQIKSENEGDT